MWTLLISLFVIGWVAASLIGTQAYFRGEQTKSIHERNSDSNSFEKIARTVTGKETNYAERVFAYGIDTYYSNSLANS